MRERVERAGVHVRPAGEPQGVQRPAERVRVRGHDGHRHGVRGARQEHQAEHGAQVPPRAVPPRHPLPVHVLQPAVHAAPGPVGVHRLVAAGQVRAPAAHHAAGGRQEHVRLRVLDVRVAVLGVRDAVPDHAGVPRPRLGHPRARVAVLRPLRAHGRPAAPAETGPVEPAGRRRQVRVLVQAHQPGTGGHHTRQHGRGHVRDTAVHAGRGAAAVLHPGGRPVRVQDGDDHHAVRVQGQPVPAEQPERGHERAARAAAAHGQRDRRPHIQPAPDAGVPAGGHQQPDGAVHRVHVADRSQPGHVVPAVAGGQPRAPVPVQKVPAVRHLRRGTPTGTQAPPSAVGPRGGRHTVLEAAAVQCL